MGKINILSAELSNKIAAGEVVERPSSVVKELVENSIDAGSTNIKVIIKEFGIQQIRIIDNGSGISNDDLARAFLRHATSKISADYDLFHIETLGFRGEALASISSVSKVVIKSCAGEAQGKMLVLEGGKVVSEEYYAPIKGTDLSVENLFYNTPARLKYLRNPHTEQANITNIIHKFALSYPNVAFELHVDGKITFTPEPDFVGTAKGLVVKRLDMYGNVVIAHYTPTVHGQTQVSDATSEGLKGQTQTGKPNFTGDVELTVPPTFEDGTTEKVVPGEGTYVISPDGTVTFTPEADFVGQAKGVKVIRKDRNGNIISGFYTPTVVELPEQVKPSDKKELSVPDSKPDQLTQNISVEKHQLPNTGTQEDGLKNLGILTALAGAMTFGLLGKKKRNDESD